ncbi:hypothetical protein ACHAO7_011033 [Fusarium culmorum]
MVGLDVEHIEKLLRNTNNGGLHYYYDCVKVDPHHMYPTSRASFVRWAAAKSPVLIRVLQLLDKHVREDGNRVLIMVDTLWIQSFITALLVEFGYAAVTPRSFQYSAAHQDVIDEWNDPESKSEVFIGNVNSLRASVKLHSCHLGILLNWLLDPSIMAQHLERLSGPDQTETVQWVLLKQANSYQDNVERLLVQKSISYWSRYDLPEWMDCEILEITACEAMKSNWHQPFNRYAWVVEYELSKSEMSYHGDYIVMLGHVFSMLARLLLTARGKSKKDFYKVNADVLVEVARRLCNPESNIWKFRTINAAEYYLRLDDETFARRMLKIIRPAVKMIREEMKPGDRRDRELVARIYRLRKSVKARQGIED